MNQAIIEQAIVAAVEASVGNPDAIAALARVELCLAQGSSVHSQSELTELVDEWGRTLRGIEPADVERLKRRISVSGECPNDFASNPA